MRATSRRRLLAAPLLAPPLLAAPLLAAPLLALPHRARAETAPIQLLLPSSPGGGNSLLAGMLAEELSRRLARPVELQNRPSPRGAGHAIEALLRLPPDGSWLGYVQSSHVLLPLAAPGLPFDPVEDFTPLATWCDTPFAVAVRPDHPARTLGELLALLRAEPGRHRYGSGGVASTQTLATEALLRAAKATAVGQHFAGAGSARAALLEGRIGFILDMVPTLIRHMEAGTLRILAVAGTGRLPGAPALPTFAESAGLPVLADFGLSTWGAILGPPGLPVALAGALHATIRAAQDSPGVHARLSALGSRPLVTEGQAAVRAFLADQRQTLERLARRLDHA